MAYSCADNSGFIFYHSTSTSHPDAPLMAIAQQLFQKQQQYQQKQPPSDNSWQVFQSWGGGRTNCRHDPPQPFSRFCCSDAFEDFSSSTASCILEPTSVLDLYSPSLDSMHSPLNLTEQRFQDIDQCLQEDVSLTENPAMDRLLPDSFANELATASSKRTFDCSILEENDEFLYDSGEMEDLGATPERELEIGDDSSEWMDCLLNEAEEVGIASCFDKNPCDSTQSSELSCYPCTPEERWSEDFTFACSSWSLHAYPPEQLTSSSNLASLALPQQQQQQQQQQQHPSHLLGLSSLYPPAAHEFGTRLDAYGVLTRAGLLGIHLKRKAGDRGLRLLQLLLDCVANLEGTERRGSSLDCIDILKKLRELASAYGDPLQRVAFYFTEAITARLEFDPSPAAAATETAVAATHEGGENLQDTVLVFRTLNEACPYIKFAHLTANQAILEATEAADRVHIIDCGIVQGVQWAALLQAFATRPTAAAMPPKIRITGIASPNLGADPSTSLAATGKRLSEFASLLNLEFEFCPVCINLEDVHPSMLRLDASEVLAVNFMFQLHHLLDDSMQHLQRTLKLVQLLSPAVITVAEYEASINVAPLQIRFLNAFCLYAAMFDSLEAAMAREDPERAKVERLFFAKEINNMMAVERTETRKERRESSENWRRLMERSGFWSAPLSHFATCQARLLLYCENFSLMEGPGCLSLGWLEHPIVTVSSWHC